MAGWNGLLGLTGVWPSSPKQPALAGWRSHLALSGLWIDGAAQTVVQPTGGGYKKRIDVDYQLRKQIIREDNEILEIVCALITKGII